MLDVLNDLKKSILGTYPKISRESLKPSSRIDDLGINTQHIVEMELLRANQTIPLEALPKTETLQELMELLIKLLYPKRLEYTDICKILPRGPGFIMVDRVISLEVDMNPPQIRAIYNVSGSAWWARDYFPGDPRMPEVLMLEGLNQVGGLLLYYLSGRKKCPPVFTGFGSGLIRKSAVPGDHIEYFIELNKSARGIHTLHGNVTVNGSPCLKVDIKLAGA